MLTSVLVPVRPGAGVSTRCPRVRGHPSRSRAQGQPFLVQMWQLRAGSC